MANMEKRDDSAARKLETDFDAILQAYVANKAIVDEGLMDRSFKAIPPDPPLQCAVVSEGTGG